MLKCFAGAQKEQSQNITQALSENNRCYVLITCGQPTQDGQMEVEMTIGGDDPVLAAYLVESASTIMDDQL
ncbi:MAG: hypothetical protein KBA81_00890 [Rhabdochlamydiaceae bacterium]|nr:hypothetical protein [Rhabdochlamydiaceae bacterium]